MISNEESRTMVDQVMAVFARGVAAEVIKETDASISNKVSEFLQFQLSDDSLRQQMIEVLREPFTKQAGLMVDALKEKGDEIYEIAKSAQQYAGDSASHAEASLEHVKAAEVLLDKIHEWSGKIDALVSLVDSGALDPNAGQVQSSGYPPHHFVLQRDATGNADKSFRQIVAEAQAQQYPVWKKFIKKITGHFIGAIHQELMGTKDLTPKGRALSQVYPILALAVSKLHRRNPGGLRLKHLIGFRKSQLRKHLTIGIPVLERGRMLTLDLDARGVSGQCCGSDHIQLDLGVHLIRSTDLSAECHKQLTVFTGLAFRHLKLSHPIIRQVRETGEVSFHLPIDATVRLVDRRRETIDVDHLVEKLGGVRLAIDQCAILLINLSRHRVLESE